MGMQLRSQLVKDLVRNRKAWRSFACDQLLDTLRIWRDE
jgi:hypothetical protein